MRRSKNMKFIVMLNLIIFSIVFRLFYVIFVLKGCFAPDEYYQSAEASYCIVFGDCIKSVPS